MVSIPEYHTPHYTLADAESHNEIGVYRSRIAALRAVADAVLRYGLDSSAIRSLILVRDDVPEEQALIASGRDLADLALEAVGELKDGDGVRPRMLRLPATSKGPERGTRPGRASASAGGGQAS